MRTIYQEQQQHIVLVYIVLTHWMLIGNLWAGMATQEDSPVTNIAGTGLVDQSPDDARKRRGPGISRNI